MTEEIEAEFLSLVEAGHYNTEALTRFINSFMITHQLDGHEARLCLETLAKERRG